MDDPSDFLREQMNASSWAQLLVPLKLIAKQVY